MSGVEWLVLTRSVTVMQQLLRAEQQLRGGIVSDALVEFGGVMVASAGDHLAEARTSPDPRRRVEDAAAALQDAYRAYERALNRGASAGVRTLNRYFTERYRKSLGRVADTAAGVAVLRAYLGEPPLTLRKWLDRVAKPVALERQATQAFYVYDSLFGTTKSAHGDASVRQHLISYFNLERLLLPPDLVRPLPRMWKLTEHGVAARTKNELHELDLQEIREHRETSRPFSPLMGATDEPGPFDVVLMVEAADVVPVFNPHP